MQITVANFYSLPLKFISLEAADEHSFEVQLMFVLQLKRHILVSDSFA
jgi:hypothetical protein